MRETNQLSSDNKVECEICLKEIPRSEATVDEVNDYVIYYCGLDCFHKWKQPEEEKKTP